MNLAITPELKEIMEAVHYRPAISIIMPFEPKMGKSADILKLLNFKVDEVERELEENYPEEICTLVMHKLNKIITQLNFTTHKKSIAIFVSPIFEKVLYLDIAVQEKTIIDESFEIRDIVYNKKELHDYLVLRISGKEYSLYSGNSLGLVKIISNTSQLIYDFVNDVPEKVANFSVASTRKEIIMDKFLLSIDKSLDIILQSYPLPLFVLAAEKTIGHFKAITKHTKSVIEYIHGNYDEFNELDLNNLLDPYVKNWKKIMQKDFINKLEEAEGEKKLAIGIKEVWKEAMKGKGKLLLIEKDYMFAAEYGSSEYLIHKATSPYNKFSNIKDAVDEVIEKVLETGGDVEFVEKDLLKNYNQIALIQYY
jgi:hypothetical protein